MGYDCTWDPEFKRTNNVDRVSELQENIQALKNIIDDGGLKGSASFSVSSDQQYQQQNSEPGNSVSQEDSQPDPQHPHASISGGPTSRYFDGACFVVLDVRLSINDAEALFAIFFEKFHPFLPCLDPSKPPKSYYSGCELLFWTVLSIAAREFQPDRDFLVRLAPHLTSSIGQMILGPPLRLTQIQALLLLSLWPPFNVHWWTDRSLTLSNLAVTGALHLGLHCPFYEHEYTPRRVDVSDSDRAERTATWIACLVVSQNLAMDFGLQTKLAFDNWSVLGICSADSRLKIPAELRNYLMVQRIGYFAFEAFGNCISPETGLYDDSSLSGLLEKFDNDVVTLDQSNWSLINRLSLATVQLNLQIMYFQLDSMNSARKRGILQAYSTAVRLVNSAMADEGSDEVLRNSPRTTFHMFCLAAMTMFKVLHSSYRSELDFDSGKILYNATSLCIRQQAVQFREKDISNRSADLLRTLWRIGEKNPVMSTMEPTLRCRTRLGASVIYDCLSIWRNRSNEGSYGMPLENAAGSNQNPSLGISIPTDISSNADCAIQNSVTLDYMAFPWDGDIDYSDLFCGSIYQASTPM